MTDQEKRDYLATELMGYNYEADVWWKDGKPITPYTAWNPFLNANDCLACELKIGAMGLGGAYADLLDRTLPREKTTKVIVNKVEEYGADLYLLITAPLKTRGEAMVKVLEERAGK